MTAYWTLAIRYADAASARPIAGDHVASRFMNADAQAVAARFQPLKKANASFPVRHRLIDERLADELTRDRGMRIIVVGCGFDSRPYRLEGGRWVEVDEGALLAYKEERLPAAEAPNELVRVPIRFAEESLEEKLRPFARRRSRGGRPRRRDRLSERRRAPQAPGDAHRPLSPTTCSSATC